MCIKDRKIRSYEEMVLKYFINYGKLSFACRIIKAEAQGLFAIRVITISRQMILDQQHVAISIHSAQGTGRNQMVASGEMEEG